jgi:hypothetical protein
MAYETVADAQAEQTRKLQDDFDKEQRALAEEVTKAYEADREDALGRKVNPEPAPKSKK